MSRWVAFDDVSVTPVDTIIRRSTYSLAGQPVAVRVRVSGTAVDDVQPGLTYLHTDHLGSIRALSDEGGDQAGTDIHYEPFGAFRSGAATLAGVTDRAYTGHRSNNLPDDDLGLIYMNARFYLPGSGRFASADTIVPAPADPQSHNRYSYGLNNPLKFRDPTGHYVSEEGGKPSWAELEPRNCDPAVMSCMPLSPWEGEFIADTCAQGDCLAGHLDWHFGIPSSPERREMMVAAEARNLCYQYGSCAADATGIMPAGVTLPLGGPVAAVSVVFDLAKAAFQADASGVIQEGSFEGGDALVDFALSEGSLSTLSEPVSAVGGNAVPVLDLALDLGRLSAAEQEWQRDASENVARHIFWMQIRLNQGPMSYSEDHLIFLLSTSAGY